MRNNVLSTSFQNSRTVYVVSPLLYPGLRFSRAASLNRAIGRGIRRSQGVGFRGKEKSRFEDGRDVAIHLPNRQAVGASAHASPRSEVFGKARHLSSPKTFGIRGQPESRSTLPSKGAFGEIFGRPRRANDVIAKTRMGDNIVKGGSNKYHEKVLGFNDDQKNYHKRNSDRKDFGKSGFALGKPNWENDGKFDSYASPKSSDSGTSKITYPSLARAKTPHQPRSKNSNGVGDSAANGGSRERSADSKDRFSTKKDGERAGSPNRFAKSVGKRIPLSIPYTTPASEFLYGTSVVEAALKSKKVPRRNHYKLYIYTGENRDNADRDGELERLARRSGVEVARVGSDWLPLLDKMSASRPHNGYILEASPLPRLPVIRLKGLTEQDGSPGFEAQLDFQSREDAAINGTSNFFKSSKTSGRKPLVLFLDSILDPGNLGGIIRTASFLGVTAIGISKNCTAFSPIVLKASAGASENITLFTVNKPAGFIADSKLAGWKIFAAVAPTSSRTPSSIFTDDLADPLSKDPCILMIGSEGEGLRLNLKTKADVHLSIRGSGRSHGVDSLNVSVATGILCDAFLTRRGTGKVPSPTELVLETGGDTKSPQDLF